MSFILPVGIDRADGTTVLPNQPKGVGGAGGTVGTPDPDGAMMVFGDDERTAVQEQSDSPEIERAEQATFRHRFMTSWSNGLNLLQSLGRGTFVQDTGGNVWRILSSMLKASKGQYSELSIVAESISFDSPPDEYQCVPVQLGIDILKHPRYSWALLPYVSDSSTYTTVGDTPITYGNVKEAIVRMIQTYRDSPFYPSANQINGWVHTNIMNRINNGYIDVHVDNTSCDRGKPIPDPKRWDGVTAHKPAGNYDYYIVAVPVTSSNTDPVNIALSAAKEIISKLWRMEDTPYIVGYEVTWVQYYFAPVALNPGGYRESPIGIVPDYFLSPAQDGSNTIFDGLAAVNPQSYSITREVGGAGSVNISWLRQADEVEYQRTWFKVTSKWIGAPIGRWDPDLYHQIGERGPLTAEDFNVPTA